MVAAKNGELFETQCTCSGAPRLLQAIARDDIIPFLSIFKKTNSKNEPIRAIILTFFIAEIGIIIANIESVAPLIDVSVVCILYHLLHAVSTKHKQLTSSSATAERPREACFVFD